MADLSDAEIARLIAIPKRSGKMPTPRPKDKRVNYREAEWPLSSDDPDAVFSIIIRVNLDDPQDFSAILYYQPRGGGTAYRLLRCNGQHEHPVDSGSRRRRRQRFNDFHIHRASEAAQDQGKDAEWYAAPTTRYTDVSGAIRELLRLASVSSPVDDLPLFAPQQEAADDDDADS